jgi:hypothetical protein
LYAGTAADFLVIEHGVCMFAPLMINARNAPTAIPSYRVRR